MEYRTCFYKYVNPFQSYNPLDGSWYRGPYLPSPSAGHCIVQTGPSKFLKMGGRNSQGRRERGAQLTKEAVLTH